MRVEPLDEADHLSLTTRPLEGELRRTGARFAGSDGRFVVLLDADARALDDLTDDPHLHVAAGTSKGEILPGSAVLAAIARPIDEDRLDDAMGRIRKKYGLSMRAAEAGAGLWNRARGNERDAPVLIEVVLTEVI
ncbi:MAG: hypothetical protein AAGA99_14320 [Actinomycetota bacterium]